jgi:hypothetical protein
MPDTGIGDAGILVVRAFAIHFLSYTVMGEEQIAPVTVYSWTKAVQKWTQETKRDEK